MSNIDSRKDPTPEDILRLAAALGGKTPADPNAAVSEMSKKLTPEKRRQVNEVLNDKAALEKLLNSPEAQQLMKKFGFKK